MSTDQKWPGISCICLTYARPHLLEEAIHSFLLQEYAGPKELIVLNDFAAQRLEYAHPEVCVINSPCRFRTVGEKMNAAVGLSQYDLICIWDDDDIYLPHRLRLSASRVSERFFKPCAAWIWSNGALTGIDRYFFHVGSCYPRSLFDQIGGYRAMGNGYDQEFESDLRQTAAERMEIVELLPQELYYIYRWSGTGAFHMSSRGGWGGGEREAGEWAAQRVERGEIPTGSIHLRPQWKQDYCQLVRDAIARGL